MNITKIVFIGGINIKLYEADNFNGVYKEIAQELGVDIAIHMHSIFKGCQVNFPVKLFSTEYINNEVISHYTGRNIKELTRKFNYSERTIRRILKQSECNV